MADETDNKTPAEGPEPQFFVRPAPSKSAEQLADEIADGLIAHIEAWRKEHGLPPLPEE